MLTRLGFCRDGYVWAQLGVELTCMLWNSEYIFALLVFILFS